ncbi:MAG TPA: Rho termination factor N-terminal domain-containing protein [Solirubrobacteraceae bacterium]
MAVLDRSDLEASSLADLHSIAGQIGLDGFRRLRKADLVDLILEKGGVEKQASKDDEEPAEERSAGSRRKRTPRRRRGQDKDAADEASADADGASTDAKTAGAKAAGADSKAAGADSKDADDDEPSDEDAAPRPARKAGGGSAADRLEEVEGEIEVLGNGSAFVRLSPPESSDRDVYISAAQVRRCELVTGDRVGGPVRKPRRSERYPSLARIDTINGEPADSASKAVKFDSLPVRFPSERFELASEDVTLKAIEWLSPLGHGSRAVIVGAARAGKTETLRRLLGALAGRDGLEITLLLLGARPEELHDWEQGPCQPAAALTLAASADAQGQELERAVETAKRVAARGGNALLAIDSLDGVHPHVARRALAAARNLHESGSLTVIATATKPFGGETTVIALDALLTSTGKLPALDLQQSGTLRPELLIGEESAAEILKARALAE